MVSIVNWSERFFLRDNDPDVDKRLLVFFGGHDLKRLCQAVTWLIDGNFSMASRFSSQLYVIIAMGGEISLPAVYVVLQRKTTWHVRSGSYNVPAEVLKGRCKQPQLKTAVVIISKLQSSAAKILLFFKQIMHKMLLLPSLVSVLALKVYTFLSLINTMVALFN